MTRHTTLSAVLLVLGIAMLVAPALAPIQSVRYHDTGQGTLNNESQIEQRGYEIVAYENMTERGQELYVRTLRNDGDYRVALGNGASDFAYPTTAELAETDDYKARNSLRTIVVERPSDADLPPPDERVERAEHISEQDEKEGRWSNRSEAELRRQIARFDVMTTRTDAPPLTETASLARLLSAVLGVLAIGVGGYRWAKP